jgi:hypothetical protein
LPVSGAPDSDHQERGDKRQLVEGIEEEQIQGSKSTGSTRCDEHYAGHIAMQVLFGSRRHPRCRQGNQGCEKEHRRIQSVDTHIKLHVPGRDQRQGGGELISSSRMIIAQEKNQRRNQRNDRAGDRGLSRRKSK